jgi:hypothetical protein
LDFLRGFVMARLLINKQNSNCTIVADVETLAHENGLKWGASFAFAAVCIGAFIILFFSPRRCSKVVPFYFLSTGLSYVFIGVSQVLEESITEQREISLQKTSYFFKGTGSILLLVLGLMILEVTPKSKPMAKKVTWWFLVCPVSFFMITAIVIGAKVQSGVPVHAFVSFGLLVFLLCVYTLQIFKDKGKIWHFLSKTLAVFIITIELFYTTIFVFASCESPEASGNCSTECALPDDVHPNGLIHDVVLFFGFAVWAWSEDAAPSIQTSHRFPFEGVLDDTVVDDTSLSSETSSEEAEDREGNDIDDTVTYDAGNHIEVVLDDTAVDHTSISNETSSEEGQDREGNDSDDTECYSV